MLSLRKTGFSPLMREFAIEMRIRNFGDVEGPAAKVERSIQRRYAVDPHDE